ncbi:MAG: O-methyltransferase [Clostridia bacterium]|nr:O-methyltransferase [Clostridia bacterium]
MEDKDFTYAHRDTGKAERPSVTAAFNKVKLPDEISALRAEARKREIPTADDETLNFLLFEILSSGAENVLEIGCGVGISAAAILDAAPKVKVTTIEKDADFLKEAGENFAALGLKDRVRLLEGDAGEILKGILGPFDFVFLDGPKVQYLRYLPDIKRLLPAGGVLFADDVLMYGYVTGERETPRKRQSIVGHIKEYIDAVTGDPGLHTTIVNIGNGVALSVKLS